MPEDDVPRIETKIKQWLNDQGYPLEMKVAQAFRSAGFRTTHAEYYLDPETKQSREIDVVASAQSKIVGCLVRITLCIECKSSKTKPWIILTSRDLGLAGPARVVQRAASPLGNRFLHSVADDPRFQGLSLLQLPTRPGSGVTQGFTTGNDKAFAACMAASKASLAEVRQARIANQTQGPLFEIAIPVVVLDGLLFESYLTQEGDVEVGRVSEGTLVWRNPVVGMPHTIVRLTTLEHIEELTRQAREAASLLFSSKQEVRALMLKEAELAKERAQRHRRNNRNLAEHSAGEDG